MFIGWKMMAASGQSGREKLNFQLTLRRRGISDQAILRALEDVPRDLFVDPRDREFAYADTALGIACGQTISQPYVVAYMTEQLRTHPRHRVLEIGTGSGYQAAVLSRLCRIVVTVERYRTLVDTARRRFSSLGYNNIEVVFGDGYDVAQTLGMFDRIIVTAAMEEIPESLMELLEPGGILIAPVGPQGGAQQLVRLRKTEEGIARDELIPVRFVPALKGLAKEL
jgi:protein-L-isoaspartate(D-aspartate) O-methyltransferase